VAPVVNTVAESGIEAAKLVGDWFSHPITDLERNAEVDQRWEALQEHLQTRSDTPSPTMIANALDGISPIGGKPLSQVVDLTVPHSSARQRFKAFVSRERVDQLLKEDTERGPGTIPSVEELGPSVWHIKPGNRARGPGT
jgi:hypothetical protein